MEKKLPFFLSVEAALVHCTVIERGEINVLQKYNIFIKVAYENKKAASHCKYLRYQIRLLDNH